MAELTQEQVERAIDAVARLMQPAIVPAGARFQVDREQCGKVLFAAAPFLQFPWDIPTMEEISDIYEAMSAINDGNMTKRCMIEFVRRRNAALLPKPVDPRRAVLLKHLSTFNIRDDDEMETAVSEILAALDEV